MTVAWLTTLSTIGGRRPEHFLPGTVPRRMLGSRLPVWSRRQELRDRLPSGLMQEQPPMIDRTSPQKAKRTGRGTFLQVSALGLASSVLGRFASSPAAAEPQPPPAETVID